MSAYLEALRTHQALPENAMVRGLGRHMATAERRGTAYAHSYATLRDELIQALLQDPRRPVCTPGSERPTWEACEVVNDHFAGHDGTETLVEAIRIIAAVAEGDSPLRLRAMAWVAAMGARHAEFHVDDAVEQAEG